ncbi:acyltransferase family protein [Pseudonocardia kujensis]|uniref:acyltransferase family protein n=1 Tax=Pseudonocardia kujensis TaxID=1128675 RepID=UPI001E51CBC9|nr:acyltransferase [Pseudonocardia kujensis]MCE0761772.1 acyltransferase family protein [Pseudonocardia kujensis]
MTTTAEYATVSDAPSSTAPSPGPAPGSPLAGGGELRALTGLRAVAAAWVVLFHFHFTALPGVALVSGLLGPLVTQGALGVDLFFVLSGFVIAYTYLEQLGPRLSAARTGRFVWARACRIWPAYALVFHMFGIWLVARAVYGSDPDIAFQAVQPVLSPGEWLQQMVMVQMWDNPYLDGASWVGSTWSISAEWLAYLLFPLVAVIFHRMRDLPVVVLAGGALALMTPIAAAYLTTGSPYYPWSWVVRILCGFGAGILTYLAVRRLRHRADVRRAASVVASAVPVLIAVGLLAGERLGPGRGGAVLVLFPVLVGALALADGGVHGGVARWLSRPAMVHGGRISYALYLIHIPIFEVFWLALRRYGGFGGSSLLAPDGVLAHVLAVVVLVATVPAAHLLFRYVEEPARAAMKEQPAVWRRQLADVRDRLPGALARLVPVVPAGPAVALAGPVAPAPRRAGEQGCVRVGGMPVPLVPPARTASDPRAVEPAPVPAAPDGPRSAPAVDPDPEEAVMPSVPTDPQPAAADGPDTPVAPRTAPLPAVPAVDRPGPGVPIDTDAARRDPVTAVLPAVALEPEVAIGLSGAGSWPERPRLRPRPAPAPRPTPAPEPAQRPAALGPIDTTAARRDPAARALPTVVPMVLVEPPTQVFPAVAPLPAQPSPVRRLLDARNADLRSPHPELAEELAHQLVGARLARGKHRVKNARPHAAPHIAGQRGPERQGRAH